MGGFDYQIKYQRVRVHAVAPAVGRAHELTRRSAFHFYATISDQPSPMDVNFPDAAR